MAPPSLRRKIGSAIATLGLAASFLVAGYGTAEAAPAAPAAVAPADIGADSAYVTYTYTATGDTTTCEVTVPSGIGYPPTQPHQLSWRSVVLCGLQLHMQGASASYVWGQDIAYYPGSQYDVIGYQSETVGRVNVPPGTWGLNSNVLLFTPPGWTAVPGTGCAAQDTTVIKCTATAGPILVS
ncbi:hypothetical protein [Streptomyces sp. NPDC088725]|uniref:hypothetical protein n=1 Tax=Streptomyces sp. NPDC088725 TaxID=3365873 RepID=UPI003800E0AD